MDTTVIEIEHFIPVEHDCTQNVSFSEALNIILSTDDWLSSVEPSQLNPFDVAKMVTFENSHLVAHALTSHPEVARALYEELSYWADNNQI